MKLFTEKNGQEMKNAKVVEKQALSMNELLQIKGGTDTEGGIIIE